MRLLFFSIIFAALSGLVHSKSYDVDQYPKKLEKNCRDGKAKIYDECSDQFEILNASIKRANKTGKTVLLVYGTEWCIWCHVIDKYLHGYSRKFNYEWRYKGEMNEWKMREKENRNAKKEARNLNRYVSENFVVAHIEGEFSPNGTEVIDSVGYDSSKINGIPFVMVLDPYGKYANHLPDYDLVKGLEIRKDSGKEYRGFNRVLLLEQLNILRDSALVVKTHNNTLNPDAKSGAG